MAKEYLDKTGLTHFWDNIKGEIGNASDAQVDDWLDRHPEATTTVQDGAITTAKLADGSVTDTKLAQSGGVLDEISKLKSVLTIYEMSGAYVSAAPPYGVFRSTSEASKVVCAKVKPSTHYTITKNTVVSGGRFVVGSCSVAPYLGIPCSSVNSNNDGTTLTITTGANDQYLAIWIKNSSTTDAQYQQILSELTISNGGTLYFCAIDKTARDNIEINKINIEKLENIKNAFSELYTITGYIQGFSPFGVIASSKNVTVISKIKANRTYTITKQTVVTNGRFAVAVFDNFPEIGSAGTAGTIGNDLQTLTITAGTSSNYLAIWIKNPATTDSQCQQIVSELTIVDNYGVSYDLLNYYTDVSASQKINQVNNNIDFYEIIGAYINGASPYNIARSTAIGSRIVVAKVASGKTYTITKNTIVSGGRFIGATYSTFPEIGVVGTNYSNANDSATMTLTTGASDNYIAIWVKNSTTTDEQYRQILNEIRIISSEGVSYSLLETAIDRTVRISTGINPEKYSYVGEEINVGRKNYYSCEELFTYSYDNKVEQGFDIYNGIIAQLVSNDKTIHLLNLSNGSLISSFNITMGHGNTCQFSNEFYDENDEFPLLYITDYDSSNYSKPAEIYVNRITRESATLIKKYRCPFETSRYLPDSVVDFENKVIYTIGHKESNNVISSDIIISKYDMTNTTEDIDGALIPAFVSSFELPAIDTIQGAKFFDGKIIVVSAPTGDIKNTQIFLINPKYRSIVGVLDQFPTEIKNYECEDIAFTINDFYTFDMIACVLYTDPFVAHYFRIKFN